MIQAICAVITGAFYYRACKQYLNGQAQLREFSEKQGIPLDIVKKAMRKYVIMDKFFVAIQGFLFAFNLWIWIML